MYKRQLFLLLLGVELPEVGIRLFHFRVLFVLQRDDGDEIGIFL